MLERVLGHLAAHGTKDAVLSLGYRPEAFTRAYPDGVVAGVRVTYAVEPEPLDTAGAIRFAALYAEIGETFVVVNGDVLTDGDVSALISFHFGAGASASIYLSPVEDPSRFGVVETNPDGKVLAFVEKPPPGEASTNLINAGIYVMEPEVLDRIPSGRRVSVERETFPSLAAEGTLYALSDGAYWLDTGTPEAYLRAHRDLLEGRRGGVPAPGARRSALGSWELGDPSVEGSVDPGSLVGDGAQVEPGATVIGSVVGAGCVVENGAAVTGSVLLSGSRVRQGATVNSSIIGHRVDVGPACSVTSVSIIGDDTVLEAGSQLAGARVPGNAAILR